MAKRIKPIHPGEMLLEEFPARRINEIVHGNRAITADTALRLARYFGTSDRFWMNLQARFDLETRRDHLGKRPEDEVEALGATG